MLANIPAEIEADNFFETVGDVKGKALVDTLSDTLSVVVKKTIADTVTGVKAETPVKTEVYSGGLNSCCDIEQNKS